MVDLILFLFFVFLFGGGFWLGLYSGRTYGTLSKLIEAIGKRISDTKE
jgi:hypothetical protein